MTTRFDRPQRDSHHLSWGLRLVVISSTLVAPAASGVPADDIPLTLTGAHRRDLASGGSDHFTLDLPADHFVFGVVNQISVDVVVTVTDPVGGVVGTFDTPARGPEAFQFTARVPGVYRVEVQAFGEESGTYEVTLRRAEPLATTPQGRVRQLVAPLESEDAPGGVVAVIRDGHVEFAHAFGMANLAHDIPFTPDIRTNIGSTSKQFTAFAIALLAERGQLSLDDDIRTHIPELPDLGHVVTLRHLLTHTGGYREFLNALIMSGRRIDRGDWIDREEIIALVQNQPELQNDPGAEWNYNNTGYSLLATVVERVSGTPFPQWMQANVFQPLGMSHTIVRADPFEIVPHAAQGYLPAEQGAFQQASDLSGVMGAGGMYTTVADLAAWMGNYYDHTVGSPDLVNAMTTEFILTSGKGTEYGLGLFLDEQRGLARWQHGGADTAHRSSFLYFPTLDAGVVVLTNSPTAPPDLADQIAAEFFAGAMTDPASDQPAEGVAQADGATAGADPATQPPAPFSVSDFDPESFDAFAGRYEMEEVPGFILTFTRDDDRYYAQATGQPQLELTPTGPTTFDVKGFPISITFHPADDNTTSALTLHQNGDHPAKRLAEEPWSPDGVAMAEFAGRYYSAELEAFYEFTVTDGRLTMHHRRLDDVALQPAAPDTFTGTMPIAELRFLRDDAGAVIAFLASNGRTRGVRFDRVNALTAHDPMP